MALVPTTKPNPFCPSSSADHRRNPLDLQIGPRIDQPAAHAIEIMRQILQPVGVDSSQIGAHQTARDNGCVVLRQAMSDEQPATEGISLFWVGVV